MGITDEHIDAMLGLEPGTTAAMRRQFNGIVGSAKGVAERAAELMNAHGVGWTRMERILRALIANVGVEAPTPAAEDAPASGPADVEALSMVHGAGLGALAEARAAQLAGALLVLLDQGTRNHAALMGAVGRLIRQWMGQGEPRPEEPKPEEPALSRRTGHRPIRSAGTPNPCTESPMNKRVLSFALLALSVPPRVRRQRRRQPVRLLRLPILSLTWSASR